MWCFKFTYAYKRFCLSFFFNISFSKDLELVVKWTSVLPQSFQRAGLLKLKFRSLHFPRNRMSKNADTNGQSNEGGVLKLYRESLILFSWVTKIQLS